MSDLISRQAAIDALAKAMPSLTTPDGSGAFDHDIQIADDAFVDAMQIIQELPSAQPEIVRCGQCKSECGWNNAKCRHKDDMDFCVTCDNVREIKSLPSIQPERPKGEWIYQSKFSRIECDQCGKVFRNSFAPKNFCPNCGADMRGEQDE